MNDLNILIIAEGEKTERVFFSQLAKVFHLNVQVYMFKTNIYTLYREMEKLDFNGDVKDVLLAYRNTPENREILDRKFAYTYLIFDFDPHHREINEVDMPLIDIVEKNIRNFRSMATYFTDETDPSKGRLYVNYPMMESFRDCDSFFDPEYARRAVGLDDISGYKNLIGSRKIAKMHVTKYERNNFEQLSKMNIFKLNEIYNHEWKPMSYNDYLACSEAIKILEKEIEMISSKQQVSVLNTAVFLLLDYYGNRDHFYDQVVLCEA